MFDENGSMLSRKSPPVPSSPDELIVLRYDSRENLVARGVLPAWEPQPRRPLPFPDAPATGYVPDPPH